MANHPNIGLVIQDRLLTAQSRQKSYADRKVRDVAFMVRERVLLRVSPMKGVMRFGKKDNLSPRFIGPFEILDRVGEVAYRLALPLSLSTVHLVFHMSMLRKYHDDPSHVLDFSTVQLDKHLTYEKESWRGQPVEAATWESESDMRSQYPHLFTDSGSDLAIARSSFAIAILSSLAIARGFIKTTKKPCPA
ncbi:uncharacterized protein [Nicotiana sylvestris]|uniref:uncharacterized protein n=1 Tax=Nicotiana sylvestris TaxID=4096 RepID=UPI00388C4865